MPCFELTLYLLTSYCYYHVGSPTSSGQALLSLRITCLIYVVVSLSPCKEITWKYFVMSHNLYQISSKSFSCYSSHYFAFFRSLPKTIPNAKIFSITNTYCVYTVLRYRHDGQWKGSFLKIQMSIEVKYLNYSKVQSHSWEANWFAASQEIPRISRNPKVHYRTHKRPPSVSILGQTNPVHIPTSHLLEIHCNIIHSSTPRSPHWSLSLRFPHQEPIYPPLLTHTRHMPSQSHSSRFYHP